MMRRGFSLLVFVFVVCFDILNMGCASIGYFHRQTKRAYLDGRLNLFFDFREKL